MKYYLIAGEASGDLHASHLMTSLTREDPAAQFRFIGGDNMFAAAAGRGTMLMHYRDLAYMGFIPVLLHLPEILRGMRQCKKDILAWQPHCVIFVDYAGFNLNIAKYLRKRLSTPLFYYIAPKIWAWKEYRIKNFKRDIDEMFSILPFEKEFFEGRHGYPIHYVGNPTADEVRLFKTANPQTDKGSGEPVILLLPGSRRQEIKDNLPAMLEAAQPFSRDYKIIIAAAPGIETEYYTPFIKGKEDFCTLSCFASVASCFASVVSHPITCPASVASRPVTSTENGGETTYALLNRATAAIVTSGTATLETACFRVPQVVCYKTPLPRLARWAFNHILKCRYISLVNLIADKEVVQELFADRFSVGNIRQELSMILPGSPHREQMLRDYEEVSRRLGSECAPDNAARIMVALLKGK